MAFFLDQTVRRDPVGAGFPHHVDDGCIADTTRMSSSKPTAAGWRRWLSTGTGTLWRILAFALLVAIVLVVIRARQATNAPPLEPWHTLAAIEASAGDIRRGDWQD